MERIVATYRIEDHEVHVIELVDEDRAWFELTLDGMILPFGGYASAPDLAESIRAVRTWLAAHR